MAGTVEGDSVEGGYVITSAMPFHFLHGVPKRNSETSGSARIVRVVAGVVLLPERPC